MENDSQPKSTGGDEERWALLRDIAVLQVKLIVDGVRDLVLVPISIVAGIISLAKSNFGGDNEFYELIRLGKKSERWINLFGAADRLPPGESDFMRFPDTDIDAMVSRVESFVVDEYRKGGCNATGERSAGSSDRLAAQDGIRQTWRRRGCSELTLAAC